MVMDIEQLGKLFEAMTKASNRLETTADNQQGMFQATAGALNDSFAAFKLSQKATLDELKTQHAQYYDMHVTQQLMISELQDMRTSTNSMFAAVMREVKDLHAKQYELQLSTVNAFDELHGKMQKTDEALQRSQQAFNASQQEFHASQQEFRAGLQEMMRSFQASQQIIFNTLTQSPHSEMAPRQ
jgi:hypothetical protein